MNDSLKAFLTSKGVDTNSGPVKQLINGTVATVKSDSSNSSNVITTFVSRAMNLGFLK